MNKHSYTVSSMHFDSIKKRPHLFPEWSELTGCCAVTLAELWGGCNTDVGLVVLEGGDMTRNPPLWAGRGDGGPSAGMGWSNMVERQRCQVWRRRNMEEGAVFGTVS